MSPEKLQLILVVAPVILLAVILHEIAHGWVANRLGDPTAAERGRLTLNPLPHIDPIGTVILPVLLAVSGAPVFGWAKPVPVNFGRLRQPKQDMVKVAIAGPLTNVGLAVLSAISFNFLGGFAARGSYFVEVALAGVIINVWLAVLNMVPILPLDGGRVLAGLLPRPQAVAFARLEPYGLLILMVLLFSGTLTRFILPFQHLMLQALL
jgi:Zn-dependent protease